ncbi:CAPA peptides [Battus philenor]|uniref:CAPA peptides n=1 Tax=Battus philenor TaxID=42288 RepID=UPI0035CF77E7
MQSFTRVAVSVCILISALATVSCSSVKLRRDGVLNLYPFPRVGRAHNTWQVPINEGYQDSELAAKRQLYAFPRVGRSNFGYAEPNLSHADFRLAEILLGQQRSHEYVKRESNIGNTGMWFGPRVGRSFSYDDMNSWNDDTERSEPEVTEEEHIERKKRQTKHV